MSVKLTGEQFSAWLKSDWGHPNAYWEDEEVFRNGELIDESGYYFDIQPTDQIEIRGGFIHLGEDLRSPTADVERLVRKWLKAQSHAQVIVSVPKDQLDAFKALVKSVPGAKVLS